HPRRHLGGEERMPAELEEVLLPPHPIDPQDLLPDPAEQLLDRAPGRRRRVGRTMRLRSARGPGAPLVGRPDRWTSPAAAPCPPLPGPGSARRSTLPLTVSGSAAR